ncbi:MAG: MobF family relaxase [Mycobacterium sp.]
MLSIHKLTAGNGYLYLIRQVAVSDDTHRGRATLADYYSSKGETLGRWMGRGLVSLGRPVSRDSNDPMVAKYWSVQAGSEVSEAQMKSLFGEGLHPNADKIAEYLLDRGPTVAAEAARLGRPFRVDSGENTFTRRLREAYSAYNISVDADRFAEIPEEIRAGIRSALAREMFAEEHGRAPLDARELSGFIARQSRSTRRAVAGFDLTFTPVKTIAVLWALAPRALSRKIERAHRRSVQKAIDFLEEHAAFTRIGPGSAAQINATGLIIAAFEHRDSRAGDPNLHTHITVSNKVCAIGPDGIPRWLALDGAALYRAIVAASEVYNTAMEGFLTELGFRFVGTDRGDGKRCVREIAGVPAELIARFSSRRAAIETRLGELSKAFQNQHGREPTLAESLALSQQATLDTRAAKHEPRSFGEQRQAWRTQAAEVLGGIREVDAKIAAVSSHTAITPAALDDRAVDRMAGAVIERVSASRSTWRLHHVRAEAERQIRYAERAGGNDAVERIVAAALGEHSIAVARQMDAEQGEPDVLRRRDGSSVYTRHGETVYSSAAVLASERRILAAADLDGGRAVEETDVALALLEAEANGRALNDGQRALVREMATSGARVQLAVAPAGTGKTTATAALASAWRNSGGTIVGLAPTAAAAEVLAGELGSTTDTIAKLVQLSRQDPRQPGCADDPARVWFDVIDDSTLFVIDEAGKASTAELDAVISHALARGASVRLIGDDHQLASVSAGGVLRDLAAHRHTLTLSEVVRFGDSQRGRAEAAASLALRAGDPAGIAFYLDHQRVHVGADAMAADMAYQAWRTDLLAGRDSVLLAPTNKLVADLNERARADRLASTRREVGRTVTLGDGLNASDGDWITTRSNARWLRSGDRTWVKNGHRWIIRDVAADGSLTVSPLGGNSDAVVRLPSHYVAAHTALGYAATIDTRQGVTADTCHVVGSDQLSRQHLYVALTRGRQENHLYFSTAEADPHRILTPKAIHPPTAVDILSAILRRDSAPQSAQSALREAADPAIRLGPASAMYLDALGAAAEHCAGAEALARIDSAASRVSSELIECAAWPVLRRHLALLALEGEDPAALLQQAAAGGGLDDARDPAAVLDWRLPIPSASDSGPLHWLDPIPNSIEAEPQWGAYLSARAGLVADLASQVRKQALQWTAATAPGWARPLIDTKPRLLAEIAVFRASHGVEPTDTRITGPEQYRRRSTMAQNALRSGVNEILPGVDSVTRRWHRVVATLDPRLTTDWFWPQLAWRIDEAARAGADVEGLLGRAMEAGGPLPDELPAAALWWRLAGTLTPVAAEAATDLAVSHPAERQSVGETLTRDPIFGAEASADPYNIEADLAQLRAEVSAIGAAGSRSPATCYNPGLTESIDPSVKRIAAAIAESDMSVQPLQCDAAGETHAVLKSLAVAAAKCDRRVLALPATAAAAVRADEDRYSHACFAAAEGIPKLQSGQWKSPVGALIIVDDADHLTADQITWLMTNAGATNSQVVLATSHETTPGPSRHLTDALNENLPWSAARHHSAGNRSTAISRITAYLKTVEHPEMDAETAATQLLAQLDASVARHRVLATPLRARLRAVPELGRDVGLSL